MSEEETVQVYRCPVCGFEQTDYVAITDEGLEYSCENEDCRVAGFLARGESRAE